MKPTTGKPASKMELFQFAFFLKYEESISNLADCIADPEEWDFSDAPVKRYSILKNYLEHIYRKLKSEGKIAFTQDNGFACFNTGLVTRNLEEIFALFQKSTREAKDGKTSLPYIFNSFQKKSNAFLLSKFQSDLPQIADFFSKPEDLLFNPNCSLIPDIDHIIEDNKERFPVAMQTGGESEMRRKLEGAIEEVKRKVKTNYKIAVPQYFNGRIQLLLPLCLTPNSSNPDLALVVHKIDSKTYTARTCLTLKMAYNNARLIVKPQSSWLKP